MIPFFKFASEGTWVGPDGEIHTTLFDDAMISMSYARTFASNLDLVWFPGADRVEGFTNLGWTLLMAAVHRIGMNSDATITAVRVMGLCTVWLTALTACFIAKEFRSGQRRSTQALVTFTVLANGPLLYFSIQGMEVGLWTLLMSLVCLLTWRVYVSETTWSSLFLGVCVVAGIVTRPDFLVVPLAALAWSVICARDGFRRIASPLLLGSAIAVTATVLFRISYYGDPVPNTYYLKMTGVSLVVRVARGLTVAGAGTIGAFAPGAALVCLSWKHLLRTERQVIALLLSNTFALVVYCSYVGGDAWEQSLLLNRYLIPALVCVWLSACLSLVCAFSDETRRLCPFDILLMTAMGITAFLAPVVGTYLVTIPGNRLARLGLHEFDPNKAMANSSVTVWFGLLLVGAALVTLWRRSSFPRLVLVSATTACLVTALIPSVRGINSSGAFALLGAQLEYVTVDGASLAVVGAGGTQYASGRKTLDLLGKSDKVIAREPARVPAFIPGHNKFDFDHSIGELRPDVIAQLWVIGDELATLTSWGYVPMRLRGGEFSAAFTLHGQQVIWVRKDSQYVRWERIRPETS
jgi:arabinofuranosyltransferase